MTDKAPSKSTDQELLDEAKKTKATAIINAVLIGMVIGIVIYGVAKNNISFFALIPLFLAFRFFNKSKNDETVEE
ncbi:MAG: FUSC family protein [Lewinella sp.]